MSQHSIDISVFVFVVALRFVIPLFIPRYPLPAIVAAMIIDAADQTIFQQFTKLNLDNYQSYDKALDVYYLSIAFLATMRNWTNLTAFRTSRFLYFYRMVGVVLFELLHLRWLLLVFPNTFEYFFDFYEAVRLRWNPARMSKQLVIGAAAFIWIVIKLPQEYWIHVAQLDTTDLARDYPIGAVVVVVLLVAALIAAYKVVWPKLPPKDWNLHFDADAHDSLDKEHVRAERITTAERVWDSTLVEKIALVAMITLIFAKMLPNTTLGTLNLLVGIPAIIIANSIISHMLIRRGLSDQAMAIEFVVMVVVNLVLALVARVILPGDRTLNLNALLFFLLMLTMIVVMYDRYRPRYLARFNVQPLV